jgi:3-deoxy-D-manno-octulosonic-acid transferase
MLALGAVLRNLFGARPVFLAASTREGEETMILDALAKAATPELFDYYRAAPPATIR